MNSIINQVILDMSLQEIRTALMKADPLWYGPTVNSPSFRAIMAMRLKDESVNEIISEMLGE